MTEILTFYAQIVTMVIFLLYIMCRGAAGNKNYEDNKERYKFDALEYYKIDVQWLSFQTIPGMLLLLCFLNT